MLYAVSVLFPVLDSVKMAWRQKDSSFLLHFVYTYYVLAVTAVEVFRKICRKDKGNYTYG